MALQLKSQLLFIGASVASALPRASTVQWGKCDYGLRSTLPAQCANISVPMDYTSANASAKYTLPLLRIPVAANTISRGSIIINFGGAGQPGIPSLAAQAQVIRSSLSPDYDLISFNPRGTHEDKLFFSCYSEEERTHVFNPDPLAEVWGDVGGLVGTAFVVRDIVKISEAVGDELINYFEISYGTVLGATLVSMFPNKVGKVALDSKGTNSAAEPGPMPPSTPSSPSASPRAQPSAPSPARHAATAAELQAKIYAMIDAARANPIALPLEHARYDTTIVRGTVVDYSTLKTMDFLSLYEASPSNGLGLRSSICAQWQISAKERYLGDYKVATRNPVPIVNNRYDPATPLESARNVSAGLAGSRVVEVNRIGHGSVGAVSKCLQNVIADFFGRGVMPEVTLCELDEPLLPTDGTLGSL
ncbi:unnamed protein product [Clonostachys rosea f. rosea IK726]|uniref:Uncharacterized protein n=1 Tax=Clonostachys rosea f. rosea IK726 TaxID=1349383 RepID=A0ACA9THA4_BIOOC|nr:unnamed protein product [Clonostachys rosea f. rosea IK726]